MYRKLICFVAVAVISAIVLLFFHNGQLDSQPVAKSKSSKERKAAKHTSPANLSKTEKVVQLLNQEVDIKMFQKIPQIKLRDLFKFLETEVVETKGKIRFYVNEEQFKLENPDAPHVLDTEVSFLSTPKRMPFIDLLRHALSRVPTRNATFLVRRGMIEVTTIDMLLPQLLLARRVTPFFRKQPLDKVLQELSDQTGVSIILDPRCGDKAQTPITATFAHNVSLEAALIIVTDMAGLKMVTLGRSVYVTTPENARSLRREHKRLQKKRYHGPHFKIDPLVPGLGI